MKTGELLNMQDSEIVFNSLPDNWQEMANECGALKRKRVFDSAETLFKVLMLHLGQGLSLRSTSVFANESGLVDVSDVALLYRLKKSRAWLEWMTKEMSNKCMPSAARITYPDGFEIRYVDSSIVKEEGKTGSQWRIHYSISMPELSCQKMRITDIKTGESFKRYEVEPGDILVGDRGYCRAEGIRYVREKGGHVITRLHHTSMKLCDENGECFDLSGKLQRLEMGKVGEWHVGILCKNDHIIKGRLCAIKKTPEAAKRALKKARRRAQKKGYTPSNLTLEVAGYVIILTTISSNILEASKVLEIYRGRWQIELVFKRLKSLAQMGQLPKKDPEAARAWLQGKFLLSFIVGYLINVGESFFPWGYPIPPGKRARPLSMERV